MVERISLFLLFSLLSLSINARDLTAFQKRFKFVRNDQGEVVSVIDRSIVMNFSIAPYLRFIKESLQGEQRIMKQKGDYDQRIKRLFEDSGHSMNLVSHGKKSFGEDSDIIVDSMKKLRDIDFNKVFGDEGFQNVISQFESKLRGALMKLDPRVMAHLKDKNFFYQRKLIYQALTWGLNFAKSRLSSVPILNTASFVLMKVEEMVRQRRIYHQNMLLHYLENFSEKELGLTHEEVNHIVSSLYESRISWYAFWESQAAKENWDNYGMNKFYSGIRFFNNRFRRLKESYLSVGKRLNYAFQEVTTKKGRAIVDLANTANMFSSKLSVAHYYDSPHLVTRRRLVAQMAELGLSFIPLYSWIKGMIENYISSFYREQTLMEGALYGYFESEGDGASLELLEKQVLNPFETL